MKTYMSTIRLLAIVSFFLTSCSPYVDIVKVEILNPSIAPYTFAGKKVAIVGNLYELGNGKYLYDSTLVAKATEGIKGVLEQSPVFENYEIPIYYTYTSTSDTSLVSKPMSLADIDSLASDMGVGMFIYVDFILISDVVNNDSAHLGVEHHTQYSGLFRVYQAGIEKPYSSYLIKSEEPVSVILYGTSGLPVISTLGDAKVGLAYRLGENYALLIAPYWEEVERVYYISPDDEKGNLRMGDRYAQRGDWARAMEYWNKTITTSTKQTQVAMAAFNMAVGCEMLGDLELAQSWLEYCQKLQNAKINPVPYMQTIAARIQDKKILDKKLQVQVVE